METLAPILGTGALPRAPRTEPKEPVEDLYVDLTDLAPAWPSVGGELPRVLASLIARGTWTDEHHAATPVGTGLRIRHRPDVLVQVRRLIANLRASLLRPIDVEVAFVDLPADALQRLLTSPSERSKDARELGRVSFSSYNGQWAAGENMSNQALLIGVTAEGGGLVPRSVSLASGVTVQAAAWRWGEDRAVIVLSGLFTGPVPGGQVLTQKLHRALPEKVKDHPEWEQEEVKLELPVRELIETQTVSTLARGEWTAVTVVPSGPTRVAVTMVKVDWSPLKAGFERIDPLSAAGYVLEVIPIALPTEDRSRGSGAVQLERENRRSIDENAASSLKQKAQVQAETQKRSTYNFQDEGAMDISAPSQAAQGIRSKGGAPDAVAAPEALETLSAEIMAAEWAPGTALEFVANHVFVVQREEVTKKLRQLLDGTHAFNNRVVPIELSFLDKRTPFLAGAQLRARHATWTDAFAGQMHAVLSSAWPVDRSTPPIQVFWQGTRIAVRPYSAGAGAADIELHVRIHQLDRLTPATIAGAVMQLPKDATWPIDARLQLDRGQTRTAALAGEADALRSIVLRGPD